MDIFVDFRRSQKDQYKRILGWPKIDLCKFADDVETYSVLKSYLDYANNTFNGFIHRCPYRIAHIPNATISFDQNYTRDDETPTTIFPNGENRFTVKFYNNRDKNIFTLEFMMMISMIMIDWMLQ